jgi:Dullard-like phosphatase family protein
VLSLCQLSHYFELVIFTASIRRYADAVIDLIDLHHVIDRRFFRQSCLKGAGGSFLKDLRVVSGTDLRRTCLVDNSPVAYSLQEENALPIATWYDDQSDTALRDIIPFMLALRSMDDIRPLLFRRHLLQRAALRSSRSNSGSGRIGQMMGPADTAVLAAEAPQLSVASTLIEEDERDDDDQGLSSRSSRRRVPAHATL